ncbi:MAG: class I SAM-dependent methyltransferase [Patescibacteria group bacterium]|jgi:ubiquinone/menaquinone biosynthesis C-methylase UbiE
MSNTFDERLVPDDSVKQHIIYNEHLIRYELAKKFVKDKTVLDIACGSGYGTKILAEAGAREIKGMDISEEAITSARNNYGYENIKYSVGNAEAIALDDKIIDVAVSFETIEHLKNYDKFLAELARVLKDDGLAVISTPNKDLSRGRNPFHIKEFNRKEFTEAIKRYFPYCFILEQVNGLATCIKAPAGAEKGGYADKVILNSGDGPVYFIAVCSRQEISGKLPTGTIAGINTKALNKLYNNPGLKIINKIYSIIIKIPGVKKILSNFS